MEIDSPRCGFKLGAILDSYADFADKVDKYNSDNMSTEDYKYYIEVTTRCAQKMLEAY